MTFREIIIAAIEEIGGEDLVTDDHGYWRWKWRGGTKLEMYFYDFRLEGERCSFYCNSNIGSYMFTIHESDLVDPNWSPDTFAKQIDREIAKANEYDF